MCEFSAYIAFNKAINGQTDIKHESKKSKCAATFLSLFIKIDGTIFLYVGTIGCALFDEYRFYVYREILKIPYAVSYNYLHVIHI